MIIFFIPKSKVVFNMLFIRILLKVEEYRLSKSNIYLNIKNLNKCLYLPAGQLFWLSVDAHLKIFLWELIMWKAKIQNCMRSFSVIGQFLCNPRQYSLFLFPALFQPKEKIYPTFCGWNINHYVRMHLAYMRRTTTMGGWFSDASEISQSNSWVPATRRCFFGVYWNK